MKLLALIFVLFAAQVASGADSAADPVPPPNALVEQPRSYGYVVGDIVTQRVLLEEKGRAFEPASLPSAGPAGVWLERRAARLDRDASGRQWLAVDYQIMNSPQALAVVTLPALKMHAKSGTAELRVGEWPISVSPLTPREPFTRVGLGSLRPDRDTPFVDVTSTTRWLAIWLTAAVVLAAAWAGWWMWRNWLASSRLPFGVALRELRGMEEGEPRAWHVLHRAFDGTAGQVVRADALSVLFERVPDLEPLRSPIERFYAQSAARFFTGAPAQPVSLRELCVELRRVEKRRET